MARGRVSSRAIGLRNGRGLIADGAGRLARGGIVSVGEGTS